MHKVELDGKHLFAEDGTLLSEILINDGQHVEHLCGRRGTCKKCTVFVNGQQVLACQYRIHSDISVSVPASHPIHSESGAVETGHITQKLCFALDIGTTTLALALVSLDTQQIIQIKTRTNPQRVFGADVITRIDHCQKFGVDELFRCLRDAVCTMIAEFSLPKVNTLYVSGNTTMLHLFFGVDCTSMGSAPYTPAFLQSRVIPASELGITGISQIQSLPSISTFVGADLVAGLNWVGRPEYSKYRLLVDLGTNAEILLFSDKVLLCTAAAAGPCFEGTNISCGMSATHGAICAYTKERIQTIGNVPAKGICGTGLVDIIATLLEDGTIDETGFMECDVFDIAPGVSINRTDVRQFQIAKSAVYAAIITLLKIQNIAVADVEKLYISGGFSVQIDLDNATKTGLLPRELRNKCEALNNSSLLGTVKYACKQNDLPSMIAGATYVDLSVDPRFSDLFIENMLFAEE